VAAPTDPEPQLSDVDVVQGLTGELQETAARSALWRARYLAALRERDEALASLLELRGQLAQANTAEADDERT
jgi:hypothetical protein